MKKKQEKKVPKYRIGTNVSAMANKPWKLIEDPTSDAERRYVINTMWDAYNIKTTLDMGYLNRGMVFEHVKTGKRKIVAFNDSKNKYTLVSDEEKMRRIARDKNDKIVVDAIAEMGHEFGGLVLRCHDLSQAGGVADKLLTIGAFSVFVEIKDATDLDSAMKKIRPVQLQYPGIVFVAASKEDVKNIIKSVYELARITSASVVAKNNSLLRKFFVDENSEVGSLLRMEMISSNLTRII